MDSSEGNRVRELRTGDLLPGVASVELVELSEVADPDNGVLAWFDEGIWRGAGSDVNAATYRNRGEDVRIVYVE